MIFSNPRATWISGYESIQKWYEKVKEFGNDAFNTAADTIRDREDEVLNYFLNRATNASAESLNSKIKQFRAQAQRCYRCGLLSLQVINDLRIDTGIYW